MTLAQGLQYLSAFGAFLAFSGYAWGYVVRPRGDRKLHVAALLFSSIALACMPILIPATARGSTFFASACVVVFLICSTVLQAVTAFRGRASDRATAGAEDRRRPASDAEAKAA